MSADPRTEYQTRRSRWDVEIARLEGRHLLLSNLRLVAVFGAAILAWAAFGPALIATAWMLVPIASFALLAAVHARTLNARDRAGRARAYYLRGFARLDGAWQGSGPDGARFLNGHPYAGDLDLFGPGSLFQLLSTARTEAGEDVLAGWLGGVSSVDETRERQVAVAELRDRQDFRESLAMLAAETPVSRTSSLASWAASSPSGLSSGHAWLFAGCALVTAVVVTAAFAGWVPSDLAVTWVVLQAGVVSMWRRQVRRVVRGVDLAERDLSLLTELLEKIERATFTSPRLRALHAQLIVDGVPLSRRIARLRFFIAARDSLRNEFVRPFALLLLVRSQSAVAIDRWHAAHRQRLSAWIRVVGEFEALSALATLAFEHPADPFPTLTADEVVFSGSGLAHPLIHESMAVGNDVALGGASAPRVLVISGSNMSGKSTLLRTVGANAALAMAGAPVRARSLTCSPLAIGATIHVQDSLQSGQSRFYAEILRIRDIVDATTGSAPVLFLLDEILHGTNSHDRRIGAEGIVRTLVGAGAIGLVTTHDLALTDLAGLLGPLARNVHFEDRLEAGRMVFDYRMRDGVVEHSNALELMRAVGIQV